MVARCYLKKPKQISTRKDPSIINEQQMLINVVFYLTILSSTDWLTLTPSPTPTSPSPMSLFGPADSLFLYAIEEVYISLTKGFLWGRHSLFVFQVLHWTILSCTYSTRRYLRQTIRTTFHFSFADVSKINETSCNNVWPTWQKKVRLPKGLRRPFKEK